MGREAAIESVNTTLFAGLMTCYDVVSGFLACIKKFNPTINSIISLDPNVLATADEMDVTLSQGNVTGSLLRKVCRVSSHSWPDHQPLQPFSDTVRSSGPPHE